MSSSRTLTDPPEDAVVLRSSWFGIAFAGLGVVCLLAIAVAVAVNNGFGVIPLIVMIAAVGSALVVLFDMPLSTSVDAEGVVRRTPLRRQRIAWDDIDRLQRMRRVSLIPRVASKGLVAMRGPRQVLLCDRTESAFQFEEMRRVVGPELAELFFSGLSRPGTK